MHYPVMTERQVAARWKVSLKTLRRWRLDSEGPIWHKLFHHVRYHQADVLEFERQSAQHWTAILGDGERVPRAVTHPPKAEGNPQPPDATEPELQYISAKDIVEATSLPEIKPRVAFRSAAQRWLKTNDQVDCTPLDLHPCRLIEAIRIRAIIIGMRADVGNEWAPACVAGRPLSLTAAFVTSGAVAT